MTIGDEIRRRREEQGLTGFELALKAGMAPSAISLIENGKRTPSSTSVLKLAGALGVEVGDLYPKAQIPLPLEDERLMDHAAVQEWLRAHGHMTNEEFLAWAEDLADDSDIEQAIPELQAKRDELVAALRTNDTRDILFPMPPRLSKEEAKNWLLKPPGLSELRNEIRREYAARELALVNYSKKLFVLGKSSGYLGYGPPTGEVARERHQKMLEARRVFEESYAKALAV